MATDTTTGVTPWYEDKKVYAAVIGFLAPIIAKKMGVALDTDQIAGLIVIVVTFIAAHSWKTATIVKANIAAGAAAKSDASASPAAAAAALNK